MKKLTYLKTFNVLDAFRKVAGDKGYITAADIHHYFGYSDYHRYPGYDYHRYHSTYYHRFGSEVIRFWTNWEDSDGKLTFEDWN